MKNYLKISHVQFILKSKSQGIFGTKIQTEMSTFFIMFIIAKLVTNFTIGIICSHIGHKCHIAHKRHIAHKCRIAHKFQTGNKCQIGHNCPLGHNFQKSNTGHKGWIGHNCHIDFEG